MPTTGYDVYNLRNIFNAGFTFRFCEGSTLTRAQALLAGWWDVGHILATDISPSATLTKHKYSRLGKIGTDRQYVSDSSLEFGIKCEEMSKFVMMLALMGNSAADLSQTAVSSTAVDSLVFTAVSPSAGANVWYNVTQSGTQLRELSALALTVPSRSVTCDQSADTITLASHGWANGTPVKFAGTTKPTGIGTGVYYVVNSQSGTFQVAATAGGTAVDFSDAGTAVTVTQQLDDGTGVMMDFRVGAVRFLYPVVQTVTVTATAKAVDANNNPNSLLKGVTPMTQLTRYGWGRFLGYMDGSDNTLVADYLFQAQISTKAGASGLDGSKAAEFDFTITVGADTGTFYVAP